MRGSSKGAPMPLESRCHERGNLDVASDSSGPLRKDKHESTGVRTSSMITSSMVRSKSTRRRPRPRQHYNNPSSIVREDGSSICSHPCISDMGFIPVARDTYYRDRQVKAANRPPPGGTSTASGPTAPRANSVRGRGSPVTGDVCVRQSECCSSIIALEEPALRDLRRPRSTANRR